MEHINFEKLFKKLQQFEGELITLQSLVARDKIFSRWVPEKEAAAILHLNPRTFRRKVVSGKISIHYRHTNKRNYQYHRDGLISFMKSTSTEI